MSEAGERYTIITEDDESANIWIVALICLFFSTVLLGVRIVSKKRFAFHYSWDDYVFIGAWALQVIQVGLMLRALVLGLGKDDKLIQERNRPRIQPFLAASAIFAILSLYAVKVSMILLISRLFSQSLRYVWIAFAVIGVVMTMQLHIACPYPMCTDTMPRMITALVFDILTEVIIIGLPIWCIRGVRMDTWRKLKVLSSFASRVIVIVFSILMLWAILRIKRTGKWSTSIVLPTVFMQLQLCFSLCIAAIIPCFRMIFQSSDVVPSNSAGYAREPKEAGSGFDNNGGHHEMLGHMVTTGVATTDTQISYERMPTPPPPPIPRMDSTQDDIETIGRGRGHSNSSHRVSDSSLSPSARTGATGISSKPLVHQTGIAV